MLLCSGLVYLFENKLNHFFKNTVVYNLEFHEYRLSLLQIPLFRMNSSFYISYSNSAQSQTNSVNVSSLHYVILWVIQSWWGQNWGDPSDLSSIPAMGSTDAWLLPTATLGPAVEFMASYASPGLPVFEYSRSTSLAFPVSIPAAGTTTSPGTESRPAEHSLSKPTYRDGGWEWAHAHRVCHIIQCTTDVKGASESTGKAYWGNS